jgi:hypothetical protein
VDNRDRRSRSSRKLSSTLRLSLSPYARPTPTRPSPALYKRCVLDVTTKTSAPVNVDSPSASLFCPESVSSSLAAAPSDPFGDHSLSYTASDDASDLVNVETVSSTSQENDSSLPISTLAFALVAGYYLPLNVISHAISTSTPLQVEPWQIHAVVCKLSLF